MGPCFQVFFDNSKKTNGPLPSLIVTFALRLRNSCNHAHVLGQHMWPSPGPWLPGQTPSDPKQWKLDVHVKSENPVRARSPPTKSKTEKIVRVQQYKSACVSVLTGSVPCKMAERLQEGATPCKN